MFVRLATAAAGIAIILGAAPAYAGPAIARDANGNTQAVSAALGRYAGAERPDQDPMLKSFDVVYVPKTAIAAVSSFVQEYTKNIPFAVSFGVATPAPPAQTIVPQTNMGRPLPPQPSVTPQ